MPWIKTRDNVDLYVKTWGEGRPVILIHGWPLSSDSWDPVGVELAKQGYRAIAYDRRGFGRSDQPWGGYDYDSLTADLKDVMAATGASENVSLVGFSMGGGEVARYMSHYDGKGVVSCALVSAVVPYMLKTPDNPQGVPQSQFATMAAGMLADRPKFMRGFFNDFFGVGVISSPVSDAVLDWAWQIAMQAGLHPTLKCAEAFATTDFRPEMTAFKAPTLIIHGTADKTVPIDATGRAAAQAIGTAALLEYEGAPHGVFATHTEQLTTDIVSCL